jgi:hypothetical protein
LMKLSCSTAERATEQQHQVSETAMLQGGGLSFNSNVLQQAVLSIVPQCVTLCNGPSWQMYATVA